MSAWTWEDWQGQDSNAPIREVAAALGQAPACPMASMASCILLGLKFLNDWGEQSAQTASAFT